MTLTVSSGLTTSKPFQKVTVFSKDRDFVIHVTLALHLQLYFRSILKEKSIENKSIYLAHPTLERQALLLLNWHW